MLEESESVMYEMETKSEENSKLFLNTPSALNDIIELFPQRETRKAIVIINKTLLYQDLSSEHLSSFIWRCKLFQTQASKNPSLCREQRDAIIGCFIADKLEPERAQAPGQGHR